MASNPGSGGKNLSSRFGSRTHLWPSTCTLPVSTLPRPRSMAEPAMLPSSVVLPQPGRVGGGGGPRGEMAELTSQESRQGCQHVRARHTTRSCAVAAALPDHQPACPAPAILPELPSAGPPPCPPEGPSTPTTWPLLSVPEQPDRMYHRSAPEGGWCSDTTKSAAAAAAASSSGRSRGLRAGHQQQAAKVRVSSKLCDRCSAWLGLMLARWHLGQA